MGCNTLMGGSQPAGVARGTGSRFLRKDRPIRFPAVRRFAPALAAFLALSLASPVHAADLFLNDEPEVYAAIDRLSALGYLPGLPVNTRPYSLRAVRQATRQAPRTADPDAFEGKLFRWLAGYVAPKAMGRLTGAVAHADARFTPGNNQGLPVPKGWSGWASLAAREETTPQVNGQLRFTSFFGEGGDNGNRLLDASIEAGVPWASVQVGKLSSWYGPGRHGALVFTSNAAPYPGVRLHNPEPIAAPGRISFLGALQYDLFVARMEKKPQFSHSLLVGTRLAAKPGSLLEVGFSRTVHYDGEGRSNGISEFSKAYFGNSEADGRSNALTGFDITLTLPFAAQPVQAYWERGVDDNSQVGQMFLPWSDVGGNILGVYLPRVLSYSRLDLRVEYADTVSGGDREEPFYGDPSYPHRYRENILGHPVGGSSRDWFVESRYSLRPDVYAGISYEKVKHEGGDLAGESHSIVSAGLLGWSTKSWRGEVRASWDRVSDEGGVSGRDGSDFTAWVALTWQTNVLVPPDEGEVPLRELQGVPQ
jgi:hypothetical protein